MANYARTQRIGEEIKKLITDLITEQKIRDSRITSSRSLISVTAVEVVRDLKYAYVYISVLGNDRTSVMEGFSHASGFIRKEIGTKLNIRFMPELIFRSDDSIERAIHMSKLIDDLHIEPDPAQPDDAQGKDTP